jgi:hypothetical protein
MSEAAAAQNSDCAENFNTTSILLGFSRGLLDHKNPRTWVDYPELDESTKHMLGAMMSPKVFMHLHYNTHTFGQLTASINEYRQDIDYLSMDSNSVVRLGVTPEEKQTCRQMYSDAKRMISQFVTTVNTNILSGDCGKLSNLIGDNLMFQCMIDDSQVHLGFVPSFIFPFKDCDHQISHFCVYFTSKLTLLQFHESHHAIAQKFVLMTGALKKFDKMCAWCGKLHGTGKHDRLLKCKCKLCRYCTKECQTMHWPSHMGMCKAIVTDMSSIE